VFESSEGPTALQRARDVLDLAERRTGVQSRREASVALPPPSSRLTSILPQGALPRGAATAVIESAGLLTQIIGATQGPGWVAIVGWPQLSALRMAEAGVDLEHTMMIPEVHSMAAGVIAGLLDGFDQVVVGPNVDLTASERRQLLARARRNESALLTRTAWAGAALQLRADSATWSGPDHGDRWLRKVRYDIARISRWDAGERRFEVTLDWSANQGEVVLTPAARVQEVLAPAARVQKVAPVRVARTG
jgi:hypothetical protein